MKHLYIKYVYIHRWYFICAIGAVHYTYIYMYMYLIKRVYVLLISSFIVMLRENIYHKLKGIDEMIYTINQRFGMEYNLSEGRYM